jgi:ABC-type polysaccharide/polyol phosphate export permease
VKNQDGYMLLITPDGITRRHRSVPELLSSGLADAHRISYVVRSELRSKVFDKTLGLFFLTLDPLVMAGMYYVLTQVLFGSRMETLGFAGIYLTVVFWRWFSRTIDSSPGVFLSYSSILKQSNFSITSVLLSHIGLEIANFLIGVVILIVFLGILGVTPKLSWLALPIPVFVELVFIIMLVTVCATVGVFFRDLQGFLFAFTGFWFYLSPGIYPVSSVPARYFWIYQLNPFAHILPAYREILLDGKLPDLIPLLIILVVSAVFSAAAFWVLARARYRFLPYL